MKVFVAIMQDIVKTFKHVFLPLFTDFFPLLGFIFFAQDGKVYFATSVLMLLTIATTLVTYVKERRLPYITLYVSFITIFFGLATLHHRDIEFIQLRDTLYDLSLFVVFILGMTFRVSVLKISLHKVFSLTERGWNIMTWGWCVFFLITACVNEYMRRYHSFDEWLLYKEFLIPVTVITALFLYGISIYEEKKKELSNKK